MSSLHSLRKAIKDELVAKGLCEPRSIIIARQTDIWQDIAIAIDNAKDGVVWVIGVAEGSSTDEAILQMDLTIPITSFCNIELEEGATPEETKWETMLNILQEWSPRRGCMYGMRFKRFSDDVELADGAPNYLARQTVFSISHVIPPTS
jgi:hypothetical protein